MTHDWRDARGSLGIPVAIFAGVGLVASLPLHSLWLGCLSAVVIAASIAVQSGFSVDLAQLRVRSWWGWGELAIRALAGCASSKVLGDGGDQTISDEPTWSPPIGGH